MSKDDVRSVKLRFQKGEIVLSRRVADDPALHQMVVKETWAVFKGRKYPYQVMQQVSEDRRGREAKRGAPGPPILRAGGLLLGTAAHFRSLLRAPHRSLRKRARSGGRPAPGLRAGSPAGGSLLRVRR
jgi:hypothetical protein